MSKKAKYCLLKGNLPLFSEVHPQNLRGHFQFHGGCDAADAHVRAVVVICPEPLCGLILGLLDAFDDVLVQPFVPDSTRGGRGNSDQLLRWIA